MNEQLFSIISPLTVILVQPIPGALNEVTDCGSLTERFDKRSSAFSNDVLDLLVRTASYIFFLVIPFEDGYKSRHICSEVGVDLEDEDEDDSKCVFVSDGIWKDSGNRFFAGGSCGSRSLEPRIGVCVSKLRKLV